MKKVYLLILLSLTFIFSCNQESFISSVKVPVNQAVTPPADTPTTTGGAIILVDSLTNLNAPNSGAKNEKVTVTFDYTTKENRYIYVAIKNTTDWSEVASTKLLDVTGSGNKSVDLTIPAITTVGTDYKVIVTMIEASDTWVKVKDADGNDLESSKEISITN